MSPKDYTPVKAGAGQTFISRMTQGAIDAGMTTDPTIAQLTDTGQAKVLLRHAHARRARARRSAVCTRPARCT